MTAIKESTMSHDLPSSTLQIQSLLEADGTLRARLVEAALPALGPDDVLIKVQATPVNPSDLGLFFAGADLASVQSDPDEPHAGVTTQVSEAALALLGARIGESLPVGNEGAGTVIAAGSSDAAQALIGRTVAALGGAMYSQYRVAHASQTLPLPEGTDPRDGASCFVNPLTALGMTETMRLEGHTALVHTAAASNLGQMLNRICLADGIDLVNIVRRPEQAELLRSQGARYVVDSSAPSYTRDLEEAIAATGATIGFDATGGGRLASDILHAMEQAAQQRASGSYNRYGSSEPKQVYIYGSLDRSPTELHRTYGLTWGVGGWLLTPFLAKVGPEVTNRLRQRVVDELHTTFASHYREELSLAEALDPERIASYARQGTGAKVLLRPDQDTVSR